MTVEIRRPTTDELPELHRVLGDVFGSNPTVDAMARFDRFSEPQRLRAAFDGDRIVGTLGTYSLQLTVPGSQISAGGTSIVTVLPTHRRQGIFRRLMMNHLEDVRDQNELVAMLWASEFSIYGRFGFGLATDQMDIELDKRDLQFRDLPPARGSLEFVDQRTALSVWPSIHDQACDKRPGMFRRWPGWWEYRVLADPENYRGGGTEHKRVLYVRDDKPCGYVLYRLYRQTQSIVRERSLTLHVIELIGIDHEAELALWRYLFSIDLVDVIRSERQPIDIKLLWWLQNQRAVNRRIEDGLWVRVVNVPAALAARIYARPGHVRFSIADELFPSNSGSYHLCIDEAGTATVDRTSEPTDVEISPPALGAIYLGGRSVRDLAAVGLASGPFDQLSQIDAAFSWYPAPWCQEVF